MHWKVDSWSQILIPLMRIRIRIKVKNCIRIRIYTKVMRIRNPAFCKSYIIEINYWLISLAA